MYVHDEFYTRRNASLQKSFVDSDRHAVAETNKNKQTNKQKQTRNKKSALFRELFLHRKWHLVVGLGQ
jgi:hypothetical protein